MVRWISDFEECYGALGIALVITKYIVGFWKLLIHVWLKVTLFLSNASFTEYFTSFTEYSIYQVCWSSELTDSLRDMSSVFSSFSPSQESSAVYHDRLLIVLALTSSRALFQWFYIIFSYVNISGIGIHFIIIDVLEWLQLGISRLMYNLKNVFPPHPLRSASFCQLFYHFIMKNYFIDLCLFC